MADFRTSRASKNAAVRRRMHGRVSRACCWRRTSTFTWIEAYMDHWLGKERPITRRGALRAAACGFGYLGLADLLAAADEPLAPRKPHFAPKAKRVIFLFMHG